MTATIDFGLGFTELVERAVATVLSGHESGDGDNPLRWRSLLWAGDPKVRVTVRELALALGCSRQTIYRFIEEGLPARRRHGALIFVVGEARRWLEQAEEVVNGPHKPIRLHR